MSSPSSSSNPRKLQKKVKPISPNPPPKGKYKIFALLDAPKRLLHPGCMGQPDAQFQGSPVVGGTGGGGDRYGGATAGNVRGLTRTKLAELQMDDVIAGKHTPPLTLRDFEDFLAFKAKASEVLYFELWCRRYQVLYDAAAPNNRPYSDTMTLENEYKTCLSTFFDPESPLELNIPTDMRRALESSVAELKSLPADSKQERFLSPSAFDKIRFDSNELLAATFKQFVLNQSRNADRNRAIFAQFLGLTTWALGLVPTIVCTQLDKSRAWRVLGLFFWWFGIVVFVGGFKRTCLVIYLFGDSRQLYPWELQAHSYMDADSRSFVTATSATSGHDSPNPNEKSVDEGYGSAEPTPNHSRNNSFTFPDLTFFPLSPPSSPSLSDKSEKSGSTNTKRLYFAPEHILPTLPGSSPTWAPFTKVMSPLVCAEQRDNVVKAAGYAFIVMCVTAVICFAVPNKHH
ncbi:hypothetical protein MNV49_007544 [Pseudohyphozyma bogoriensis]|nr:hypothetical protein MNV49_007544 [Pseudohyphozyma bogoriensis]